MTGTMFSSPEPQATPAPKPPATMPDSQSPAVMEARRKAQMDIMGRAGRQSTILTSPNNRPSDYTGTTLGSGA